MTMTNGRLSKNCVGRDDKPVKEFNTQIDAYEGANASSISGLVPYECNKCSKWHLSPKDRITPSKLCPNCKKEAYETEQFAHKRALFIKRERGINLTVYECECGNGWHLTSQ